MFPLVTAALLLAADPAPRLVIADPSVDDPTAVRLVGLDAATVARLKANPPTAEQWAAILRIRVSGAAKDVPPLLGTYTLTADGVRFEPRFPYAPGVFYSVTFDRPRFPDDPVEPAAPAALGVVTRTGSGYLITVSTNAPRTAVVAVDPSAAVLPENALRFYVRFSRPISRKDIYRHVTLTRDDGKVVADPFLELDEQLWNADGTRLTLLLDPGRVKRGLAPREQAGPVLEEGRRYTLTVDAGWEDEDGRPLRASFRKTFAVGPPDDAPVDPSTWTLIAPRKGTDAPLVVRLAKSLDRALLGRLLWVTDAAGAKVPGTVSVGGGERVMAFAPAKPWAAGTYRLVVDRRLEDVCGNRVGEPFQVDAFHPVTAKVAGETVERPFAVK